MTASTGLPALTMIRTRRGFSRESTSSCSVSVRDEVALRAVLFEQGVGLRDRAVVQGNGEAVAGQVAGEVGAHHRQAGDTDVC